MEFESEIFLDKSNERQESQKNKSYLSLTQISEEQSHNNVPLSSQISRNTIKITSPNQYSIETKKFITKVKRTSSKKYKRKPLTIVPLYNNSLIMENNFVLFGYIFIEQNYKDYENMLDCCLQDHIAEQIFVDNIQQAKDNKLYSMNFSPVRSSGIQDFQFLIDFFQNQPNSQYKLLGDQLQDYQILVKNYLNHVRQIQKKIHRGLINIEKDIQPIFEDAKIYFQNYIKDNFKNTYSRFTIMMSNFKGMDMEIIFHGFTENYANLVGIDLINAKDYLIAKMNNQYGEGDERLISKTECFSLFTKDLQQYNLPVSFYTNDGILIRTSVDLYKIHYPHLPEWLNKLDIFLSIYQLNITDSQAKQIQEQRQLINHSLINHNQNNNNISFEQLVLSEIFIEKYYTNHMTQNQFQDQDKLVGIRNVQQ